MLLTLLNNRYRIVRTLGSGGFGTTYLAEDTQMPSGRCCVVKQLKPLKQSAHLYEFVQERFQREAATLEELGEQHDQIPQLYAYFTEGQQFYLVQEWIEGQTLLQRVQSRGPLKSDAVQTILMSLLSVLDYVHSRRIIHRDIKPSNVILRHHDGEPVLIDFGAVKETMGTVVNTQGNSSSSVAIGTPGFMSAEQAAGRPVYASDLYSVGLTAIYLLTGKLPHEMQIHPETGDILWTDHAKTVDPALRDVLNRATQSHPRDRYPTAQTMLRMLDPATVADSAGLMETILAETIAPPTHEVIKAKAADIAHPPILTAKDAKIGVWQKVLLAGGFLGASVIVGLTLASPPERSELSAKTTVVQPLLSSASPLPTPSSNPSPLPPKAHRLSFSLGSTGTIVRGRVLADQPKRYIINCKRSQQITANLTGEKVSLTITTPTQKTLTTLVSPLSQWKGLLPQDGDYLIEISSKEGSEYVLSLEVL